MLGRTKVQQMVLEEASAKLEKVHETKPMSVDFSYC